ncbi:MAG: acyltransferase domain-containing protein [Armatimonadota bacterium]
MGLDDVLAELDLADERAALAPEWDLSQAAMPAGELPFLAPSFVRSACADLGAPDRVIGPAVRAAERIARSGPLRALIWHLHYRLYRSATAGWDEICGWPVLKASLGADAGLFYLLLVLSNLPAMRQVHRSHQVPEAIVQDTMRDVDNWLSTREETLGLMPVNVAWLSNHLSGNIYRLGRLQFQFADCQYDIRVLRHRVSRAVLALAGDGVRYNAAGQVPESGGGSDGWTARLSVGDDAITGYPIVPVGKAVASEVTLPADEWETALAKGDPVLNIHIPGGGPLAHDLCGDSIRQALDFFPRHFPERPFAAFCCGSWILNTWLQEALPATANLVRFQREFYLFPIRLSGEWALRHVFDEVPEDLSQAPRDTQLRRAMLDQLASGQPIPTGGGGCFMLPEDFRWGEQVYLNQRLPVNLNW